MLERSLVAREIATEPEPFAIAEPRIAVLIPCYNEELTVAGVVENFRRELPAADIYVFDNNSSDRTVDCAREAGAKVYYERRQGKGYVVQSMFNRVDADIYIMVDGDGTYPPDCVRRLIEPVLNDEADMVVGSRLEEGCQSQFKRLNRLGNNLFLAVLNFIFKVKLSDILSGYRVFNRKFVKNIPLFGAGFEIETELTIKALERGYRIVELPVNLGERPEGSHSKIRLVHDGLLILNTILTLFRDYKPLTFFGSAGLMFIVAGFIPGLLVIYEFIETGLVPRLPSAVLAVGLVLCGMLLIMVGLVLHTMVRRFQELDYNLRTIAGESSYDKAQRQNVPAQISAFRLRSEKAGLDGR
jgi:glycosyltransferase involved in cell wall biosynthesis